LFHMATQITAEELKRKIGKEEPIIIVDVRTDEELQFGKIRQAIHIPMHLLPQSLNELDKNKQIILYCHSGQRSSMCAEYLEKQGFKTASLIDGILSWKKYQPEIREY